MDSSASIEIKTLQKSPSVGFKLPPPEFKQTYNDNEFVNLLNARKSTPFMLHLTLWQIYNLLLLISHQAGRLLEKVTHFIIEELTIIGI